jgi:uncharacterized protein (TIGR02231 family)
MKKILSIFLFVGALCNTIFAEQNIKSTIKEVTVYLNGAKVTSMGSVAVPAGSSEIIFENLSPYFYAPSLQVKMGGDVKLLSAKFRTRYPEAPKVDAKAKIIQDSLVLLGDLQTEYANQKTLLAEESNLIKAQITKINTSISGASGTVSSMSLNELKESMQYYRTRRGEIDAEWRAYTIKERNLSELVTFLTNRLYNLAPKTGNTTGEVVMQVTVNRAQTVDISCIYLVTNASWTPLYDISSDGTDKPVSLTYKGSVKQTTGFDWQNVKLHFSTSNPFNNNSRPILNPMYVNYVVQQAYYKNRSNSLDNTYNLQQAAAPTSNMAAVTKEEDAEKKDLSRYITDDEVRNVTDQNTTSNNFQVELDVPLTHTILATGEEQIIQVETYDIPAMYQYHAVPKLEAAVFLLAKITNYGQYNLMPGNANIFYQNTLIGQSFIDPKTVADTLLLSFGRDENISIKRVKPADVTAVKVIGTNKKETLSYEITVKNNKSQSINIEILDQIPISMQADIVVELEDAGGAEYTKDYGKLLWRLTIPANGSKKIKFAYSMKYPKDRSIGLN